MTFNEWILDHKEWTEVCDIETLRAPWEALEEEGVSDEAIVGVFDAFHEAIFGE